LSLDPTMPGYSAVYYRDGGGDGVGRRFATYLNTLYSLRVERLSDTSARFSVLNSAGSVLAQNTRTLSSFPDPLFVAMGTLAVDATFDNLQVSGNVIPEPGSASLLLIGGAVMWLQRLKGRRETIAQHS
jgi:hypothetical protein